jgi:hypothetical protein
MEEIEDKIHELIHDPSKKCLFVVINQPEINILKNNRIKIKGIEYHNYESYDMYRDDIIEKYKNSKFQGDIYLLGSGQLSEYSTKHVNKTNDGYNIYFEFLFNTLKYISKYGDDIEPIYTKDENIQLEKIHEQNKDFVEILKCDYKTSLFYSKYDTGIIGVEGYCEFCKVFLKYINTIKTIYIVKPRTLYLHSNTITEKFELLCKDKVKYIEVDIALLFKTNPELIAYYRIQRSNRLYINNFIEKYKLPYNSLNLIDENILIGTNSYRNVNYNKDSVKWFPKDEVTHIINVSNELITKYEIPSNSIIYEHYPIDETDKDETKNRNILIRVADRIHELIQENPKNKLYVHCSLGVNRSPSVVLMYYIKYCNMTLYEAYKFIAEKRRIFTSIDLFDIIYKEAIAIHGIEKTISPLKLRTHYAYNFCESTAYLFSLYDVIYLENLFETDTLRNSFETNNLKTDRKSGCIMC